MDDGQGAEREEQRRAQGSAVAGLNAFAANVKAEARAGLGFLAPDDALLALAGAVDAGTVRVPRLFVLDSLVKLASRRPDALQSHEEALDALLQALVRQAGVPLTEQDDAVVAVRRALDSVAQLSAVAPVRPWPAFARQAAGALRLTQAEIDKPLCNDAERVVKGAHEAVGVTVEFYTDAAPGELRDWCDPTRWHECSAYFQEMTPWDDPQAADKRLPNGWRRDLVETVEFSAAKTLVTPLRFTYTIQDETDPRWVHLDYVLLAETEDIVVDEGALDARRVTSGKHAGRTRVSAKKAILFIDPVLATWPSVACDTFWTDLVVVAAAGCPDDASASLGTGGTVTMAETTADRLAKVIDDAAASAQASIAAYAKLAKEAAAAQPAGDAPADPGAWLRLTASAYAQAATDTAKAWNAYTEVLRILANPAEPPPP
jgi:hypothetical protein